ncbi:hypothetical protein OEZ85_011404 [Tetradesmus obliquus]|uniref:SBP-type domain-containing protein n=1 Tax=Tetradesmus obliquus TaxID=3088 RepID=A0ABY8TQC0_TETOB|nr:hypothetical protein OEZ85_011404 [Tetradesmus obliquus]
MCQVPGCTADLAVIGKSYSYVKRICPIHMKADIIPCGGDVMRYCQQCGVLEPLSLFDFTKRSCRGSLSRRVKRPVPAAAAPKRKRQSRSQRHSSSNAPSNAGEWAAPLAWAASNTAAGAAAAFGCTADMPWDADAALYAAAAEPLPQGSG